MITKRLPDSWQDLQAEVARILAESGFAVEVEKVVASARGNVEVDVYAEESVRGRRYSIACECKYWKKAIPQTVVHSFRTVVAEIGANVGYVVSLKGFQAGAFAARDLTNIELVTWPEFQTKFLESWYEGYFSPTVVEKLESLMTYSEPFLPKWFDTMSENDKETYLSLKKKYDVFGMIMQSFGPYTRMFQENKIPTLPLIERLAPDPWRDTIPHEILIETHYRDFLDLSLAHGMQAIAEYRQLRDKYAI